MIQVSNDFPKCGYASDMGFDLEDCFAAGTTAPRGVQERLGLLAYSVGAELAMRGEVVLEDVGVNAREYTTLAVLVGDEPRSQQELAKLLGKAPAIVVAIVDDLEGKGLVERRRDERDRRRSVVSPTAKGRKALQRGDEAVVDVVDAVFAALSVAEREQLHDMLRRCLTNPDRGGVEAPAAVA
jgi:MarR family transcriptional regulator, lower aerobic nicotinate degradation pathway regulator